MSVCIISGGLDGRHCAGCCGAWPAGLCGRAHAPPRAQALPPLWSSSLDLRPCVTLRHRAQQDAGSIPSRTSSRRFLSPKRSREWPFLASNGRAEQNSSMTGSCGVLRKQSSRLSRLATIRTSRRQVRSASDAFAADLLAAADHQRWPTRLPKIVCEHR